MFKSKAFLSFLSAFLLINTIQSQQVHQHDHHSDHPCAVSRLERISLPASEAVSGLQQYYDVGFYFLDLQVTSLSTYVQGKVEIHAKVTSATLDTFQLDLESGLIVDSVRVNGNTASFSHPGDYLNIMVQPQASFGAPVNVHVYYHGQSQPSGFFSGISSSYSNTWQKRVTWTLSEPFNARQWWPCKQDLTDKADSAWIFLTTDSAEMAGSNGLLTEVVPLANGKVRYEWKTRYPIAYYLISFAVSDYMDYSIYANPQGHPNPILIQNFIYDNPACFAYYKASIDETPSMVELFSDLMGLYPFHEEKYGHCQAQLGGGMEHQTMSTMGDFNFRLIAHELAHQWYGDNVTCATWSDIWINEGFATYSEYLSLEFLSSPSAAASMMQNLHSSVLSSAGGSVYVPPAQVYPGNEGRIFSGRLTYNKGAVILNMLRWELQSDSLFFAILKGFQQQFADSVATADDFRDVVSAMSGKNFDWFFDQWFYGEGYPTFNITWRQEQDSLIFTSIQVPSTSITPFFKCLVEYRVLTTTGDTLIQVQQDYPVQTYAIKVSGNIANLYVDPRNQLLNMPGSVQVGVPEIDNVLAFSVYPNPNQGVFRVLMPMQGQVNLKAKYILRDVSGRIVSTGEISGDEHLLSIPNISKGVYLLHLHMDGKTGMQKLVVQ